MQGHATLQLSDLICRICLHITFSLCSARLSC